MLTCARFIRFGLGSLTSMPIFPSLHPRAINRILRDVFRKLNAPAFPRYFPHGGRQGAAQKLMGSGDQWPIVASVGRWNSLGFKGYVGLSGEMSQAMGNLLVDSYDFESEEEGSVVS